MKEDYVSLYRATSGAPTYVGIDLAWGEKARTGVAVLDGSGRLQRPTSLVTDADLLDYLAETENHVVVAAIDAPLVVPNESGSRPCEREVSSLFGRFHAGAHPSHRGMRIATRCMFMGMRGQGSS